MNWLLFGVLIALLLAALILWGSIIDYRRHHGRPPRSVLEVSEHLASIGNAWRTKKTRTRKAK